MIDGGREVGGVYVLTQSPSPSSFALFAIVSSTQWHYRLGHAPTSLFCHLGLPSVSSRPLECEFCQLGKHHRVSFPARVNTVSSQPFALVHSYIWGLMRVHSVLGFQYFVTFVDDHSGMTWLYLLKERSKFPYVLNAFYQEIKTQFGFSIKVF